MLRRAGLTLILLIACIVCRPEGHRHTTVGRAHEARDTIEGTIRDVTLSVRSRIGAEMMRFQRDAPGRITAAVFRILT